MRKYLYALTSKICENCTKEYRCSHGYRFYACLEDFWWLEAGHYEPLTTSFLSSNLREGDMAIDVGAHIGIHTIHMASIAKFVVAIEPERLNFSLLKRNIVLNNLKNVVAVPAALSDRDGSAELCVERSTGLHSLEPSADCLRVVKVKTFTLDTLLKILGFSRVDLLKIDVEGHEFEVLKGARNTLANNPPRFIVIETWPTSKALQMLQEIGYEFIKVLDRHGFYANFALKYD